MQAQSQYSRTYLDGQCQNSSQKSFIFQQHLNTDSFDDRHYNNQDNQLQMNQRQLNDQEHSYQRSSSSKQQQKTGNYLQEKLNNFKSQMDIILDAQKLLLQTQSLSNINNSQIYLQSEEKNKDKTQRNYSKTLNTQDEEKYSKSEFREQLSLERVIKISNQETSSFLPVSTQMMIVTQLNNILYDQLYTTILPILNLSYNQSIQLSSVDKILSYSFFLFLNKFIHQWGYTLNHQTQPKPSINTITQLLIYLFTFLKNYSLSMVYQLTLIIIILLPFLSGILFYVQSQDLVNLNIITTSLVSGVFLTYQTLKFVFYWLVFFIVLKSYTNSSTKQSTQQSDFTSEFICTLAQIKFIQVSSNDRSQLMQVVSNKFWHNNTDKFFYFINTVVKYYQTNNKSRDKTINNIKNKPENHQHQAKQLSDIIFEMFNRSYAQKLINLLDKLSSISSISAHNTVESVISKDSHPIVMLRKLCKYFLVLQTTFHNLLTSCINKSKCSKSKYLFQLTQIYYQYQCIVNKQLLRTLETICQLNIQIQEQNRLQQSRYKGIYQQKQRLFHLFKPKQLISQQLQNFIQLLSSQELSFKNQLYEFQQLMIPLVKGKLNEIINTQELYKLICYLEQSISIKLFLLNSKKSSLQTKSFTVFKSHCNIQKRFSDQIQVQSEKSKINKTDNKPVELSSFPDRPQISQYLIIKNNSIINNNQPIESPLILYQQFTKNQNTLEKLDNIIERLAQNQNVSQQNQQINCQKKHPQISSKYNYSYDDSQSQSSGKQSQSSSDDQDNNSLLNRPFNPFAPQQPNKPNIFSKSPLQFSFNVQQEMSDLFKQKLSKTQTQQIKQYQ